jgi:hypothetical protein
MKHLFVYVLFIFLSIAIVYFTIAFISWELNPKEWEVGTRILCAFFSLSLSVLAVPTAGIIIDNMNKR